jgi:hypothetical protein
MQSTTKRGYGTKHQRLRRMWQRRLDSGEFSGCARCGLPIVRGMRWDPGHEDSDRSHYSGPGARALQQANRWPSRRDGEARSAEAPNFASLVGASPPREKAISRRSRSRGAAVGGSWKRPAPGAVEARLPCQPRGVIRPYRETARCDLHAGGRAVRASPRPPAISRTPDAVCREGKNHPAIAPGRAMVSRFRRTYKGADMRRRRGRLAMSFESATSSRKRRAVAPLAGRKS